MLNKYFYIAYKIFNEYFCVEMRNKCFSEFFCATKYLLIDRYMISEKFLRKVHWDLPLQRMTNVFSENWSVSQWSMKEWWDTFSAWPFYAVVALLVTINYFDVKLARLCILFLNACRTREEDLRNRRKARCSQ